MVNEANSVDLDEVTHNEPPQQDLCCMQIQLFSSLVLQVYNDLPHLPETTRKFNRIYAPSRLSVSFSLKHRFYLAISKYIGVHTSIKINVTWGCGGGAGLGEIYGRFLPITYWMISHMCPLYCTNSG